MPETKSQKKNTIPTRLIAPCGMNCRLCRANIREKKHCSGCRDHANLTFTYCIECKIRNCEEIAKGKTGYCFSCDGFPCKRLKQLDKRYRTKYNMSMIENLENIRDFGVRQFIRDEKVKWACPECGELISVHLPGCPGCGYEWRSDDRFQR